MISFAFTPEQDDFRKEVRRFASAELAPRYIERASRTDFPWDAHKQVADLGILGIGLPEEFGGTGEADPITLGVVTEALAYGDINVAAGPIYVGLVAAQIAEHAQHSVAAEWIPRLIAGEAMVAIAVTEPGAGSDVSSLAAVAKPVDGGWKISGEKIAISHAMNAQAALVYARDPNSTGHSGVSCYLVPLDAEGVTRTHTIGMGALPLGWGGLSFDEVFIPTDHLVGEPGRGFAGAMSHFDFSRPAIGLACLGAARGKPGRGGWLGQAAGGVRPPHRGVPRCLLPDR